jgi:GxxExxY protein
MAVLVYPELSYKIVGVLYSVYNRLGYGYQEKYYQRAVAKELEKARLHYRRERKVVIKYRGTIIWRYFIDFVVKDKIVVELKIANDFYKKDMVQVLAYLKSTDMKLGILFIFTKYGLKFKRIVN